MNKDRLVHMDKNLVRKKAMNFLGTFGNNIKTKLSNVCSKTGQYNVPSELFQKRTPRSNRVLISWRAVKNNKLTLEQLNAFEGGVVIEFLNNDFFSEEDKNNEIFLSLKNKIGSNENISAIISIRSEGGSSSSAIQREAFAKLINNTTITYNNSIVTINSSNYREFKIKQLQSGGTGNDKWSGFLFVSIRGGQQDTIETHHGEELTIFNPACEYASQKTRIDLDLVTCYFMMKSIDIQTLDLIKTNTYNIILKELEEVLKLCNYNHEGFVGNLYDYCINHPSVRMYPNQLTDPIQLKKIDISCFNQENRVQDSVDFTHNEAVNFEKYYWDTEQKTILSPARPSNIFWSYHLSNMMQQDFTLEQYFDYEKNRYELRLELLGRN